jgi:hypothetical protein
MFLCANAHEQFPMAALTERPLESGAKNEGANEHGAAAIGCAGPAAGERGDRAYALRPHYRIASCTSHLFALALALPVSDARQ